MNDRHIVFRRARPVSLRRRGVRVLNRPLPYGTEFRCVATLHGRITTQRTPLHLNYGIESWCRFEFAMDAALLYRFMREGLAYKLAHGGVR